MGCLLDDNLEDEAVPIVAFDVERRAVGLSTGRGVPLRAVSNGVVVDERPGSPLMAAAACWTPAELHDRAERLALLRGARPTRCDRSG